ncbi:MAG: OmpH family outer membrane protein [Nitrospirae bacterium]|nr:OmpH family outer membrane protein [Nitrospirota bacterium]
MKRILLVMIVVFAVLAGGALSSVNAADLKIGFCDIDRAANDSEEGKKAIAGLRDYMSTKQAAVQEKGKALDKMKSDLDKQGSVISPDARKSRMEELERTEREFQRMVSDANMEFEKKRRELTESVYKEILEVIDKYGQQEKYSVVLPIQSMVYGDKSLDITDIIIKKYNEKKGATATPANKK